MKTLHFGLRVADLKRSLAFYAALGYEIVGSVPGASVGDLTMIKLPGDAFVTIELVSGSSARTPSRGDGLSHFVIKVESMDGVLADSPPRASSLTSRQDLRTARTSFGPHGSPIRTAIASSSCSGRPATPTASPRQTGPTAEHRACMRQI